MSRRQRSIDRRLRFDSKRFNSTDLIFASVDSFGTIVMKHERLRKYFKIYFHPTGTGNFLFNFILYALSVCLPNHANMYLARSDSFMGLIK